MAQPDKKNTKPIVSVPTVSTDSESVISMVLGALVVLVIGALIFSYVRDWRTNRSTANEITQTPTPTPATLMVEELPTQVVTEKTESGEEVPVNLPAQYTVKQGDSTWKIAQAFYGSGFNYVDIEEANGLKPEQEIAAGVQLTIPKVAVRTAQKAAPVNRTYAEKPVQTPAPDADARTKGGEMNE